MKENGEMESDTKRLKKVNQVPEEYKEEYVNIYPHPRSNNRKESSARRYRRGRPRTKKTKKPFSDLMIETLFIFLISFFGRLVLNNKTIPRYLLKIDRL